MDNINVGSVFLDRRLLIRRFPRDASSVFRMVPSDFRRPPADKSRITSLVLVRFAREATPLA